MEAVKRGVFNNYFTEAKASTVYIYSTGYKLKWVKQQSYNSTLLFLKC